LVDQVGGRGLLHESWVLRHLKEPFCQRNRERGSERALPWGLCDQNQGWCVDGCADRGRRVVMKSSWLNGGRECDVMWVYPQQLHITDNRDTEKMTTQYYLSHLY
jgi:hypothetical protein